MFLNEFYIPIFLCFWIVLVLIEKLYLSTFGIKTTEGKINYHLWQYYNAVGVGVPVVLILNIKETQYYAYEVVLFLLVVVFSIYKAKKGWVKAY